MNHHDRLGRAGRMVAGLVCVLAGVGPALAQNINLRLGPLYARTTLGVGAGIEYTDNVDLEEDDPKSDFLIDAGPTIALEVGGGEGVGPVVRLPGGEEFKLRLNASFSTRYSVRDGSVQTYGAPITADVLIPIYIQYLGWTVAIAETFDHTRRTVETTFGFGQRDLSVYNNKLTLSAYRSLGRVTLNLGATRNDQITTESKFDDQEYTRYTFSFTPSYALNETMSLFWANSYNITQLHDSDSRDSAGWSSSVGISGLITRNISGSVSVGYSRNTLEAGMTNGVPVAEETFEGINNNVTLNYANPLRPYTTHSLGFFHSVDVPTGLRDSNITEAYGLSYTISHLLNRWVTLSPRVSWTHQTDLEDDDTSETVNIVQFSIGLDRQFTAHISGGVRYEFQLRDSDIAGRSYEENRVSLRVHYAF